MPKSVAILDEDHVVGLVHQLMKGDRSAAEPALKAFFAPEVCDMDALWSLAAGLTEADGVRLVKCKRPEDAIGSDVLLFRRGQVTREMMESNPALVLVQRWGERSDMIDCAAAKSRGVWVSCLQRPMLHYVAEHVLLLALALLKKLVASDRAVRDAPAAGAPAPEGQMRYNWPGIPGVNGLYGKTIGIIGMGEIGSLACQKARALGMRVLYFNRTRLPEAYEAACGVEYRTLDELLEESDIVSLHATFHAGGGKLIDAERLARMKRGAIFINTGRGQLVDEAALFSALRSGALAGAGLDVHGREPRHQGDPLFTLDNVILTPHLAGGSRLGTVMEIRCILENVRAAFDHRPPVHCRVA